mgnify:CR=1 FL=1
MAPSVFARYIAWHYSVAPRLIVGIWGNFLWGLGHIFSVDSLYRSLFTPWKRIIAERNKKWDLEDYASAVLANIMSRIIGAVMRLTLVLMGRFLQLLVVVMGGLFYAAWFVMPLILASLLLFGVAVII